MAVGNEGIRWMAGIFVAGVSIAIFDHFTPNITDIRNATPFNQDVEGGERVALIASTMMVAVTAGLMQSIEVFIVGGVAIIATSFALKHANALNPDTGKVASSPVMSGVATSYPMPNYQGQAA
jgi:hypothetical protein